MEARYTHRIQGHLLTVTRWNIKALLEAIPVQDQRDAVEIGDIICTFPIIHQQTKEIGHSTMWYKSLEIGIDSCYGAIIGKIVGRAAKWYGKKHDESYWGDLVIRREGKSLYPMMTIDQDMIEEGDSSEARLNTIEDYY